jgi:hypothetical protein
MSIKKLSFESQIVILIKLRICCAKMPIIEKNMASCFSHDFENNLFVVT